MTKLTCEITELIQKDFTSLWKCKQGGDTLEITTPYLLPDSTLFSVFLTIRAKRYIVCDGGSIAEILAEHSPIPSEEIDASLEGMAARFKIKVGTSNVENQKLFFKECGDISLISSLIFDVASFAVAATNSLISTEDGTTESDLNNKFSSKADAFLKGAVNSTGLQLIPRSGIEEVPDVKFSAVLKSSSKVWLISYVNGATITHFKKNIAETKMNFDHAWGSRLSGHIVKTIPLLNDEATGYKPQKFQWQLAELEASSKDSVTNWKQRESLIGLIAA